MWALARDDPVILGVTFLSCPAPTKGARAFARPRFPGPAPYCQEPGQASFCPCTLRRSSDPPELAFGRPCYLFAGVPPQPNRPPGAVPWVIPRVMPPAPTGRCFIGPSNGPGGPFSWGPAYAMQQRPGAYTGLR